MSTEYTLLEDRISTLEDIVKVMNNTLQRSPNRKAITQLKNIIEGEISDIQNRLDAIETNIILLKDELKLIS